MYKNSLIFFHAPEQSVVGAAWIPINVRKWKPGLGYSTVPVADGSKQVSGFLVLFRPRGYGTDIY